MSDAGKNQEPSMEEILASIRRIIAEDEAGRARSGPAPVPPRPAFDSPSRPPRPAIHNVTRDPAPPTRPAPGDAGEMVLDLTNMVAADGSVVTIAPTHHSRPVHASPPPIPAAYTPSASEQQTVSYGGFSRRPPPPGPGAEPRSSGFSRPVAAPPEPPPYSAPAGVPAAMGPMPPNLSEDSPSRRVFKRRHTAGSAFAELAQTGFTPPPAEPRAEPRNEFGQVPSGVVATELDMSTPPVPPTYQSTEFQPDEFQPSAFQVPDPSAAPPSFRAEPAYHAAHDPYTPALEAPPADAPAPAATAAAAPSLSEDQVRAIVAAEAEPLIRIWLENNLGKLIEERLASAVRERIAESMANLPEVVDQRIHQNVETNLGPYIEDRVGAHVDARLAAAVDEKMNQRDSRITATIDEKVNQLDARVAAAVEEKINATLKQQVATAVNQQIAQAVSAQVTQTVSQQLQGQQQNITRVVDDRVKSEIRGLFQRLAGN